MKKGMYFLKDKKCDVYRVAGSRPVGVFDTPSLTTTHIGSLWCYSKQLNQNLIAESGVVNVNDETRLFVLNYNSQIDQKCYILYRSTWYKVNRVDTTDDYNGELFIYVIDCPVGEEPSIS